ncbi:MAG: 23S rRNA (guanosine(2251)-2'-O)-methyltransferase RlmB [Candidatus Nomurabacteria bacterium]|nr:MAG: 23S rRNA (guanosine(2251)-2'-O)-methyltransferase RlmB [Candidatus Nomurabacteria bacterium]
MKIEYEYIYGKHAVFEALDRRPDIVGQVFLDENFSDQKIINQIEKLELTPKLLNLKNPPRGISAKASHQGVVVGIVPDRLLVSYKKFVSELEVSSDTALLILGEVQDPHNVGAVIRSAAAFGLAGVLIPPHNQAPVTGTVIKVSAGMAFRIPLVTISNVNSVSRDLQKRGFWVYGLDGEGTVTTTTETYEKPTAFILGNEGSGLRQKTKELCDDIVSVPIHGRCESLNAAAATAVVLASWSAKHPSALIEKI